MNIEHIDLEFKKLDLTQDYSHDIFDNCKFNHCNLSEIDFQHNDFDNCTFINCNLSMPNIANSRLKNVEFVECKLVGVNFMNADTFLLNLHFSQCIINRVY